MQALRRVSFEFHAPTYPDEALGSFGVDMHRASAIAHGSSTLCPQLSAEELPVVQPTLFLGLTPVDPLDFDPLML